MRIVTMQMQIKIMSGEIQTSHPDITLTEFFGGLARGTCLQVNSADHLAESNSIQLTRLQAEALALALIDWLTDTGWPTPPPLTPAQLDRLQAKVRQALGKEAPRA